MKSILLHGEVFMVLPNKNAKKLTMIKSILLAIALILCYSLTAQQPVQSEFLLRHQIDEYCGSNHFNEEDIREPEDYTGPRYIACGESRSTCYSSCTPTIPTCKYRVPIVFTVITDGNGTCLLGTTEAEIIAHVDAALARCNNYYAEAGIEFIQCQSPRNADGTDTNFDSADLYDFDATSPDSDDDLLSALDVDNVINIYLVPVAISTSGNSVCGYAYSPTLFGSGSTYDQRLRSVIKTSCLNGDQTTFEHELGHFFGLAHTHHGASGSIPNEAADGSEVCDFTLFDGSTYSANHATAKIGDGIADTSPDPNLSGDVANDCTYDGTYVPDGSQPLPLNNIMSYSNDFYCSKMIFTPCQLEKIQDVLLGCRDFLICDSAAPDVFESNLDICIGTKSPTFIAAAECYSWYSASTGGTALATGTKSFTPPMSTSDLNTAGTYTYYLAYDNDFYNTGFSGSFYDTYNGHPLAPTT